MSRTEMVRQIKERLIGMRLSYGFSLQEMAEATNRTVAEYEQAEKDGYDYSFNFLYKCAKKFNVDVSEIISGENPKLTKFQIVKGGKGLKLYRREKFNYEHLSYMLKNSNINPFKVVAVYSEEDEKNPIRLATHNGEEFDYILKGKLKVIVGSHEEVLEAGDSISYNSSQPHGMVAVGGEDCEFIAIVSNMEHDIINDYNVVGVEADNKTAKYEKETRVWNDYISVQEREDGSLEKIEFNEPDNFNFAYDVVDKLAKTKPQKTAMVWLSKNKEKKVFTFQDMSIMSSKAANLFASQGIKKGDKVMLVLKRHYNFWFALLGLHKLGAVIIPATHLLTEKDFDYRFKAGDVKSIVCTADGDVAHQVELAEKDGHKLDSKFINTGSKEGWISFEKELESASSEFKRPVDIKKEDEMIMFFTSGTTGYPRLAMHNYQYPLGHFVTAKYWHKVNPDGLHFTIADTGWGKALWGKIYGQWLCEGAVFTYDFDRFDANEILPLFAKYHITTFCAPPTMYRFFIKEDLNRFDLSSIEHATIAGEALNPEVFNKFYEATGLKLMEGFGQTETTLTVANLFGMNPKPGSMGKPNPQYEVDIVDIDGNSCQAGVTGEIVVKKKAIGLFDGYYKNEEYTKNTWENGVYHSGDTAWKDEDGYYWYVGRNDDIIKSSGYRIGPFEIESVLMELPYVLECAVTGAPDPIRGQVIKATIVLTKGKESNDELKKQIQTYFKERTAPYKYPRIIEFVDSLPKTISGKIRRVDIRNDN